MRKLTVIRRKAFAGCLGSVKIYISDATGDTYINGTKCKFLGKVKNNGSATFEIPCESVKIFANYDKIIKDYYSVGYIVPEGEEDCSVSGIVHFNPSEGNPFYFDNSNDVKTVDDGRGRRKQTLIFIFTAVTLCILAGIVGALLSFFFKI